MVAAGVAGGVPEGHGAGGPGQERVGQRPLGARGDGGPGRRRAAAGGSSPASPEPARCELAVAAVDVGATAAGRSARSVPLGSAFATSVGETREG